MEAFLNSQLFAIIIGIVLTTITASIGQLITIKKEERLYDKERETKEMEWLRNEKKAERETILNIYKNAFSALSAFIVSHTQIDENNRVTLTDLKDDIQDIIDSILIISFRFPDNEDLHKMLVYFSSSPQVDFAYRLREMLSELVKREESFFLTKPDSLSEIQLWLHKQEQEQNFRKLNFKVDKEFRKEQLIKKGAEINEDQIKNCILQDFTESQREKLSQMYLNNFNSIPKEINLYIPKISTSKKNIIYNGEKWYAKLNPEETNLSIILSSWENDFNASLKKIEKQIENHKA